MKSKKTRRSLFCAVSAAAAAMIQPAITSQVLAQAPQDQRLAGVSVQSELQPDGPAQSALVLERDSLDRVAGATLASRMQGPGITESGFGAGSSRPVLRGQDGDRVVVLQNLGASHDVSTISSDHAVPLHPLLVDRVEVLRGPSALLYGGNAVGGVVNVVDAWIARDNKPSDSRMEIGGGGAGRGSEIAALASARIGQSTILTAGGARLLQGELRTPQFTDPNGTEGRRALNSQVNSTSYGIGVSTAVGNGRLGASVERFESLYGVPKELDATIDLSRERLGLLWEQPLQGFLQSVRVRAGLANYRHHEIEDGAVASEFKNRGQDVRVEFSHAPLGFLNGLKGIFGVQAQLNDQPVASNEEFIFLPSAERSSYSFFMKETLPLGQRLSLDAGLRADGVRSSSRQTFQVSNLGDSATTGTVDRLAGSRRNDTALSAATGLSYLLSPGMTASVGVSAVERVPSISELYSGGEHHATGLFEAGNPALGKERSRHIDLRLASEGKGARWSAGVFHSRFNNYLTLVNTGSSFFIDEGETDGIGNPVLEEVPFYLVQGLPAQLTGIEASWERRFWVGGLALTPKLELDIIKTEVRGTADSLPRSPAPRLAISNAFQLPLGPGVMRLVPQWRLYRGQSAGLGEAKRTPGAGVLDLYADWSCRNTTVFLRASNLLDQLAFNATTVEEVRGFVPESGRALFVGVRQSF